MKKNTNMTKMQKTMLGSLFLILVCFMLMLLSAVVSDYLFLKSKVINNQQQLETVTGTVKTVRYYHGGKSGEVMKLSVKGFNKWLLMGKVSKDEAPYFVKGKGIVAEVYQTPPNRFSREYNQQHTVLTLGVSIDNKIVRASESRKQAIKRQHYVFIAMSVFALFVSLFGLYFIYKSPTRVTGQ